MPTPGRDALDLGRGAEDDGDHRRDPEADEREADGRGDRTGEQQRAGDARRGQQAPAAHERLRAPGAGEPVADEAADRHRRREGGEGERRDPRRGVERLPDVDGAPVGGRALADQRAEADGADRPQRARRPREQRPGLLARVVRVGGQQRAARDEADRQRHGPDAEQVPADVDVGARGERAHARSDQRAAREGGVEGGQDRALVAALDGHAVRVHRDVERAVARAEQHGGREHEREARGERRQRDRDAAEDEREERGAAAAPARRQPARHRHRDQRAERDQPERQPQLGLAEVEALLDRRDARRPRAEEQPVEEEDDGDRAARGPGARSHGPRLEARYAAIAVRFGACFSVWRSGEISTTFQASLRRRRVRMTAALVSISHHFRPCTAERGKAWWL